MTQGAQGHGTRSPGQPTKPPRAYLCGCKSKGDKPKLIVEVSEKMSRQYVKIIDMIKTALEKDGISKEEARKMRSELCKKYT